MKVWLVCLDGGKWVLVKVKNKGYVDKKRQLISVGDNVIWGYVFFDTMQAYRMHRDMVLEVEAFTKRAVCACGGKPRIWLDTNLVNSKWPSYLATVFIDCEECGKSKFGSLPLDFAGDLEEGRRGMIEDALKYWDFHKRKNMSEELT